MPVEAGGIAIAKNGDLLVTQGTYVAVLNPVTGSEITRFGSFKLAFHITVDRENATDGSGRVSTGNIFVTDIKDYCVQVFSPSYAPLTLTGNAHDPVKWGVAPHLGPRPLGPYGDNFIGDSYAYDDTYFLGNGYFNRPAGVEVERNSGMIAVVDSLNGKVKFFGQNGEMGPQFGSFGLTPTTHSVVRFTYPQAVHFEYDLNGVLERSYILDTYQSYVMVLDATAGGLVTGNQLSDPPVALAWPWLSDIAAYGHDNGKLIVPSDIYIDKMIPGNNRLLVTNGFGSISVFGLTNLQPYNVNIDNITSSSMRINWTNTGSAFTSIRIYRSTTEGVLGTQVGGDLPNTTTSYTDSPLSQYTTYYYTVRTVVGTTETTNISQVSAKTTGQFNLAVNISGNGQVNGTVSCTGGTCNSTLASDTLVTLTASPATNSIFEGWTGDCFTTADTCLITMDGAKTVTAFFTAPKAFRVNGAYFDNLQDAYREATDGSTIQVLAGTWPSTTHATEYMTAWQTKNVTIVGGYDATFTNNAGGMSVVTGRTNLTAGKVVMKQFKIR